MWTHTKIICTMGPSCNSLEKILELIDAGMNVARLNFSHGTQEEHLRTIENLKKARAMKKVALAIMLDTKGPEIRVGVIEDQQISIEQGQRLLIVSETVLGNAQQIQITPAVVASSLQIGMTILFDDGYLIANVVEKNAKGAVIEFQNSGVLKSHKGVNVPHANIPLPALTQQDIDDIAFGCKNDIDCIAASFIRSAEHVLEIKKELIKHGKPDTLLIAKIESSQGVAAFDAILAIADGIMVARGDLGVELPLHLVPPLQKMMIRKCRQASKPVITATQMLESMIKNPRPTRAEVSDVANAIYDTTSCVMLSGETAVGAYPVETVKMMKNIIAEAEKDFPYTAFFAQNSQDCSGDLSCAVALAAVKTAYSVDAKAIFACTRTGSTARLICRFRPLMPIFALAPTEKIFHQMALNWGVISLPPKQCLTTQEAFEYASECALTQKWLAPEDLVVLTAGSPFAVSGSTNMMVIHRI